MTEKPVIYTAQGCQPCSAAKKWLKDNGVEYYEKGAEEAADAGYRSVPVIVYGDSVITGFNVTKMKELFL